MCEVRVVLIGKTGSGKSSTGNAILGGENFSVNRGFASQKSCEIQSGQNGDMALEIIDCPGLDALSSNLTDAALNIMSAVAETPCVHVFLYVVSLNERYTHEDYRAYKRFKALFGNDINRHMIVVFTAAENMLDNKQGLDSMMQNAPDHLKEVLKECSGRYITLDNISNKRQTGVGRLLNMIRKMTTRKDGRPYVFSRERYCDKVQAVFDILYTDYEEEHDCELQKEKEYCDVRDVRESVARTDDDNKEQPWQTIKPQTGQVSRTRKFFEGIKEDFMSAFISEPEKEEYFRFLLMGKTGSGKSATGNTIFGENMFPSELKFSSQTSKCDLQISKKRGRTIEIMDSPGLYDTSKTQETIGAIIVQAVACTHPGPHAILYVVRIGRYTEEEYGVYNRLKALFDEGIKNYIIIVFTGGDELEESGKVLAEVLKTGPKYLLEVVEDCNHRTIVFNNKAKDKQPQVERLLAMVREITAANGDKPYMCPKYAYVGEGLEKEVERRMEAVRERDLEREQYVKELEEKKRKAEEEIKRQKEEFERKEQEREEEIRQEKERRERETKELREKLERKEEELKIQREKELAMKEEERKEEEEKARELEQQQEALHLSIRRRVQEQTELMRRLAEDRQREIEEIRKKEEEREEYEQKRREEEKQEEERRQRAYDETMRNTKQELAEPGWVEWAVNGVKSWFW